ncbi:MAG: hypothetical protein LBS96_06125 [Oscillospiraceae bacterium]|jgi:hypothetical protein|nr:hypothetical protein [Oscillospiraceae bacterium]
MKKKRIIIIVAIIVAVIQLFPLPIQYKDGGPVAFRSIVNLYSITRLHQLRPAIEGGYDVGIEIRVLGMKVYRNVRVNTDSVPDNSAETEPASVRELLTYNEDTWDSTVTLAIPEFAGVTFECTSEKLTANGEDLIWGMPIFNVYLADLNGDTVPEICATVSVGSGISDVRVAVYDYFNKKAYNLSDRMTFDYHLSIEDGELIVTQTPSYMQQPYTDEISGKGKLTIIDDELIADGIDRTKPS